MYRFFRGSVAGAYLMCAGLGVIACGSDADVGGDTVASVDADSSDLTDLADVLRAEGLESLASAVADIDVTDLAGTADYTFFAPNDDAFRELGADAIADLLADPEALEAMLANHIVSSALSAEDIRGMESVEAVSGRQLVIDDGADGLVVADAAVTASDLTVGGARVHTVDRFFGG